MGDAVTVYTSDGLTHKAIQREEALNRAVQDIYEAKLIGSSDDFNTAVCLFLNRYSFYRDTESYTITAGVPDSKAIPKGTGIRAIKTIVINAGNPVIIDKIAYPLTSEQYQKVINNSYSNYLPSVIKPKFYEQGENFSIEIGGGTRIIFGGLEAIVLKEPVYTAFSTTGSDILAPGIWEAEIVAYAKKLILGV